MRNAGAWAQRVRERGTLISAVVKIVHLLLLSGSHLDVYNSVFETARQR